MATTDQATHPMPKQPNKMTTVQHGRRYLASTMAAALVMGMFCLWGTSTSASATPPPPVNLYCAGTATSSSIPAGTYSDAIVAGICRVNAGHVVVTGNITVRPGAALVAAFAKNDVAGSGTSGLTVGGDINVDSGGTLFLGCGGAPGRCLDDPSKNPRLTSSDTVNGSVVATDALGVVIQLSTIDGDVTQSGGGGGVNCVPSGFFATLDSTVLTAYVDNTISGNLRVIGLHSCSLAGLRNKVGGSVTYSDNTVVAVDEFVTSEIAGNLICSNDSPPMGYGNFVGSPNVVGGYGTGQCAFGVKQPNPAGGPGLHGSPAGPLTPIAVPNPTPQGYWLTAGDGGVFSFGVPFLGSLAGSVGQPVVGMAAVPGGSGYNLAGSGGGVAGFGAHVSDCPGLPQLAPPAGMPAVSQAVLNKPVVGIASAPGGNGCWLAAADGGVFGLGSNAPFYGSAGALTLNQPVVGIAAAPGNDGYYLVAADGGVFAYGPGASFHGSMGGQHLNQPIVGITVDPSTGGYWLVAKDGGVFSFDAPFLGSMGGTPLNKPVVGIAAAATGNGYYLVAADGGIFTFGPGARFLGSTGGLNLNEPVVGMALGPTATRSVTIRITLAKNRVVAGRTIKGVAFITNTTSNSITVETCAEDGWLDVGLVNKAITFDPASSTVACAPSVHLAPGLNRIPISVMTTFQSCTNSGPTSVNHPRCTPTGIPPLPAGHYTTKVVTVGLPADTLTTQPVSVTLLPR